MEQRFARMTLLDLIGKMSDSVCLVHQRLKRFVTFRVSYLLRPGLPIPTDSLPVFGSFEFDSRKLKGLKTYMIYKNFTTPCGRLSGTCRSGNVRLRSAYRT